MNTKVVLAATGATVGCIFGGMDLLLEAFCIILVADTIAGMIKGFATGTYASKKFRLGLCKKCGYMLAIILAVQLDRLLGDTGALRGALLFCFITNEATSIIENLGEIGVPLPDALKNAIAVLRNKSK